MGDPSVQIGNAPLDVLVPTTTTDTSVQAVHLCLMELKNALELRKLQALTPYKPQAWEFLLSSTNLTKKYPSLAQCFPTGFFLDFPIINLMKTPPNKFSISKFQDQFDKIIQLE